MFNIIKARIHQGYRTFPFPGKTPVLPERFLGRPILCGAKCSDCGKCTEACPVDAISMRNGKLSLDMGKCIFCGKCQPACDDKAVEFSRDYSMAAGEKNDLLLSDEPFRQVKKLDEKIRRIFGRSLRLRQVSAGGCNACEADINVLSTPFYDLGRFGIQFVASPRHADGLVVTGPVTENMKSALTKTYNAVASPKIVIAVGSCAISGGPFVNHPQVNNGADKFVPVDLYIPGCPPHPMTILDGLLRLLGRIE